MIGILCLFIWNVALAAVPSILLCLHHDFKVHVESEGSKSGHCGHEHQSAGLQQIDQCSVDGVCTDLELQGGDLIPSRLNEMLTVDLPIPALSELSYSDLSRPVYNRVCSLLPPVRGPPVSVHWLTDTFIQKTVLRV